VQVLRDFCNGRLLVLALRIVYYSMSMGRKSATAVQGYLSVVLHAHLPYIRYPEHERHLEERWLYEAMTETYLPILDVLDGLVNDGVDFQITLSLTPTLIEMLEDNLLMERYESYLEDLLDLTEKEVFRTRRDKDFGPLARMYLRRFSHIQYLFDRTYRKDLVSAFRALADSGRVRIIASAATHAYLPALMTLPAAADAQIRIGIDHYRKTFGKHPGGIWLPECGFVPELDSILRKNGVTYFFLDSHGLLNARPQHRFSIYAPLKTPSGVVAFSRDAESSKQIWSSIEGYPGDYDYRDFYRDIGFDLDTEYVGPYLPGGIRTFTGLKYYRITGRSEQKEPYVPEKAFHKAKIHAGHFVDSKNRQVAVLSGKLGIRPVVTAAFDAELFGHWWFEGPEWLNYFLREGSRGNNLFTFINPPEYIREHQEIETAMPSASSWGDRGYSSTWIHPSNHWIYRHLNKAAKLHSENCRKHMHARGILRRALNQSSRELLLAQASDWAFMMKTGNSSEFAQIKFREHLGNFFALHEEIVSGQIDRRGLLRLERKNNVFRDIDFRIFGKNGRNAQLSSLSKG
jgi:1,4-alpha-glucan branching enzyme